MRNFLLGLVAGALGTYVALKLVDEESRNELCDKARRAGERARDEFDNTMSVGRSKALRARVIARNEVQKGKQKVNEVAGDIAGKLSDELADFEAKAKANAAE